MIRITRDVSIIPWLPALLLAAGLTACDADQGAPHKTVPMGVNRTTEYDPTMDAKPGDTRPSA